MTIRDLQPARVFGIFDEITKVPRPSKKEEKIRQYLIDFAHKNNVEVTTDAIGNVLMTVPATPGHENAPTVILQGHMDMVCESNDKNFDFDHSPITTIVDGEWVHADGTTLGADNGIGVAASLAAVTDPDLVHGPLKVLVTVDEETGMTGTNNLGPDMLKGDILLNLDSEDDAQVFVGCAGGVDTTATFKYTPEQVPAGYHFFRLDISGGLGGHSGSDIHLGRLNANRQLARFLYALMQKHEVVLSDIDGGNLRNAIPRASHAVFGVPASKKEEVVAAFNQYLADIKNEYGDIETTLKITLETAETPAFVVDGKTTVNLIKALFCAPHGAMGMSRSVKGVTETSTNLASVKMLADNKILVTTSQRSFFESRKWELAYQVEAVFTLAGAEVSHGDGYPGWQPNMDSKIMKIAADAYEELFNIKPLITAIHAGLECGLFLKQNPNLDMVSFGPTLQGVHSPSERMHIPAVQRFWEQLKLILAKVADMKK